MALANPEKSSSELDKQIDLARSKLEDAKSHLSYLLRQRRMMTPEVYARLCANLAKGRAVLARMKRRPRMDPNLWRTHNGVRQRKCNDCGRWFALALSTMKRGRCTACNIAYRARRREHDS